MTVRLAFAVAAHLEPDILIIDEVLAVGDAEFQKKAIGKMQDISKGEGRTVLFVSHNMAAVKSLCTRAIVLEKGTSVFSGDVSAAIDYYFKNNTIKKVYTNNRSEKANSFTKIYLTDQFENDLVKPISKKQIVFLNFYIKAHDIMGLKFGSTLFSNMNVPIISFPFSEKDHFIKGVSNYHLKIKLPISILKSGSYFVEAALWKVGEVYDQSDEYISFNLLGDSHQELSGEGIKGVVINNKEWEVKDI